MYDAMIVGARCAGSPTAMLLARRAFNVLLLDRATFPSDTMSTHILWPHGAEVLAHWGNAFIDAESLAEALSLVPRAADVRVHHPTRGPRVLSARDAGSLRRSAP